jgi:hypothetical protein
MADYFTHTVIQPTIPNADMTPLERLLLTEILTAEPDGDGLYFFSKTGPANFVVLPTADLKAAFTASAESNSTLRAHIAEAVASLARGSAVDVELDLSRFPWEFIFQDIVRRSATLNYVTAVSSFTCSKMRPDGFGGMAVLITAGAIKGKSTEDIIEDFIAETDVTVAPQAP